MARSDYIYLVYKIGDGPRAVVAAFTVKHELASWIYSSRVLETGICWVIRVRDNYPSAAPAAMDILELEKQGYEQALDRWKRISPEYRDRDCVPEPEPPRR